MMMPSPSLTFFFCGLGIAVASRLPSISESPIASSSSCPTLCIDGINECGVGWGDCYNVCKPELSPTPPPCTKTKTESPANTPPPVYLGNQEPYPDPTTSDDCSTRTVCADYINECGMMYGGCFPDCRPWPSFTPPPCPPCGNSVSSEPLPTATDGKDEDCERFVCIDMINECGMEYGGCHPDCAPYPTYTPPPCP